MMISDPPPNNKTTPTCLDELYENLIILINTLKDIR